MSCDDTDEQTEGCEKIQGSRVEVPIEHEGAASSDKIVSSMLCSQDAARQDASDCDVYAWVGELIDTVPTLRGANARWMHEVKVLEQRMYVSARV